MFDLKSLKLSSTRKKLKKASTRKKRIASFLKRHHFFFIYWFLYLTTMKHHKLKTLFNTNLSFNSLKLLTYCITHYYLALQFFFLQIHIENFKYRHLILTCGYNKPLFTYSLTFHFIEFIHNKCIFHSHK